MLADQFLDAEGRTGDERLIASAHIVTMLEDAGGGRCDACKSTVDVMVEEHKRVCNIQSVRLADWSVHAHRLLILSLWLTIQKAERTIKSQPARSSPSTSCAAVLLSRMILRPTL